MVTTATDTKDPNGQEAGAEESSDSDRHSGVCTQEENRPPDSAASEPVVENGISDNESESAEESEYSDNESESVEESEYSDNESESVADNKDPKKATKLVRWNPPEKEGEEYSYEQFKHFEYYSRDRNPSLVMRMRDLEFQTAKECMSMGRGYINMGEGKYRYRQEKKTFRNESKNWSDDVMGTMKCSVCGLTTSGNIKDEFQMYCSYECLSQASMWESDTTKTSIFDLFYPGEAGTVEIGKEVVDGRAPCTVILESQQSMHKLMNFPRQPKQLLSAQKGDDVLVKDETKGFRRGVVVEVNASTYKVGLIDYGEMVDASAVYATTENLKEVISFGGIISFIGNETPRSKLINYRVKESRPFGVWLCDAFESDEKDAVEVMLEEWIPPLKMYPEPLPSGCIVVITKYLDAKTMYVRRATGVWNDEYSRYNNDIAVHCIQGLPVRGFSVGGFPQNLIREGFPFPTFFRTEVFQFKTPKSSKTYKTIPSIGEVCCAPFEKDGSYYRGVVRRIEKDFADIFFEDSGTEQLTKLSDLRYLPALARQVRPFCTLVTLKNVTLLSSPGAMVYLNRLTAYKCELIYTCVGNSTSDVVLTDKFNGDVVNDSIRGHEVPIWRKTRHAFSKTGEVQNYTTVHSVSLECGELNDIFVLYISDANFRKTGSFWGTLARSDYLGHLEGELKARMTEFGSHLEKERYLPRKEEVCMAKLKGEWRRAVCLGDRDVVCKLMFIDIGTCLWIETKYIRKILRDFLEMPALAVKCTVSGFKDMRDDEKEDLLYYLKSMYKKTLQGVKVLSRAEGNYFISLTVPPDFDIMRPLSPGECLDNYPDELHVAIIINFPKDVTYESLRDEIQARIDFEGLEIESPKYRKLGFGQLAIEIKSSNCIEDSELLVEELSVLLDERGFKVGYLTQGKLKISLIEKSATEADIIEKIAEVGGCEEDEVQITTMVPSGNYKIAWVKCPLAPALSVAESRDIVWGMTEAKIELEQRRPIRCFRCLHPGHVGVHCPYEAEDSKCFRCLEMGHITANCDKRPHCSDCDEKGLPALHCFGSENCASNKNNKTKISLTEIFATFNNY